MQSTCLFGLYEEKERKQKLTYTLESCTKEWLTQHMLLTQTPEKMLYGEKLHPFSPHCACMLISQAKHISILNALSKEATINVVLKRSIPPPSAKHCDCGTVPLDD